MPGNHSAQTAEIKALQALHSRTKGQTGGCRWLLCEWHCCRAINLSTCCYIPCIVLIRNCQHIAHTCMHVLRVTMAWCLFTERARARTEQVRCQRVPGHQVRVHGPRLQRPKVIDSMISSCLSANRGHKR